MEKDRLWLVNKVSVRLKSKIKSKKLWRDDRERKVKNSVWERRQWNEESNCTLEGPSVGTVFWKKFTFGLLDYYKQNIGVI